MHSPNKPRIAILSLHPYNYGGVLAVLKTVYQFCQNFFEPTVFFLTFDPSMSRSVRSPFTVAGSKKTTYFGMNCVEVGSRWAVWEPGHYQWTQDLWEKELEGYDYFFAVSGTVIAAHPLALLHKKFVVWAATPYDDDRADRIKTMPLLHRLVDRCAQSSMHDIEKTIIQRAASVGAMSRYAQQAYKALAKGSGEHILHIGSPVALPDAQSLGQTKKEKMILAVGRFDDPRKNSELLFQFFEKVYAVDHDTTLVVVGNHPPAHIIAKHEHNPAFKSITLMGHMSDEDLHALYASAAVFVITSHQEGLGIVGLEAMAHGVPVVSTDCGGPRDFVLHDTTGFLVPRDDATAMADAVLQILHNNPLHQRLSTEARKYVEKNATHDVVYTGFRQMLCHAYPDLHTHFMKELSA
jgi:glycosyltransferase involved in cell wall biosynthesis